jgi:hypothetical protein
MPSTIPRAKLLRASKHLPIMLHSDGFKNAKHIKYKREAVRTSCVIEMQEGKINNSPE